MTTNLPFSEWTQVFPNPRLCKALLDRITDRAHIIETGAESYRFRRTLEVRQKKKVRSGCFYSAAQGKEPNAVPSPAPRPGWNRKTGQQLIHAGGAN